MDVKGRFYRIRLSLLMYGFARLIWFAGLINKDFGNRLAEGPFSFVMKTRDDGPTRYFHCVDGKLRSGGKPLSSGSVDFGLVWRDTRSGGRAMYDMLLGKPKTLYKAVEKGVLLLEGDAKMVFWFLKTTNRLHRVFRPRKKTAG